ncbi:MAG: hydrogenase nickel incorporation protein HypB [Lachnospiraceae bacterium]|nr:hydrogenase nickel incorporation protein HypB [Lachnospiraceae bacterium]MBQ7507519.1 hydrogenase nickel incorporation protein HypB [Lachnospiraceae bacterium]
MGDPKIIEVKESVFADNNREADSLRKELKEKGLYLINLMSSPGSGKTTILSRLIKDLAEDIKIAVMEADIDSDVDARRIDEETGARVVQLHTGGMCHLTAAMTRQGLEALSAEGYDLAVLENVGNLVCPAEFDTGSSINVTILSVPEGDDKPLKYPLMYQVCDVVILNKMDTLPVFDFDLEKAKENVHMRNPKAKIFPVSAKTGEGFEPLEAWVREAVAAWKERV